jgi:hypothetical protein
MLQSFFVSLFNFESLLIRVFKYVLHSIQALVLLTSTGMNDGMKITGSILVFLIAATRMILDFYVEGGETWLTLYTCFVVSLVNVVFYAFFFRTSWKSLREKERV